MPVMSATALSPPKTDCLAVCDRATGELVWSFARASSVVQTPLTDGTNVYFATVSGYLSETELFACRLSDGAPVWKTKLPAVADSSPLLSGGRLVFGLHDGNLHVVEASSGDEVAAVPLDTRVFSSPVLSGGRLFIGAQDGKLHCLK